MPNDQNRLVELILQIDAAARTAYDGQRLATMTTSDLARLEERQVDELRTVEARFVAQSTLRFAYAIELLRSAPLVAGQVAPESVLADQLRLPYLMPAAQEAVLSILATAMNRITYKLEDAIRLWWLDTQTVAPGFRLAHGLLQEFEAIRDNITTQRRTGAIANGPLPPFAPLDLRLRPDSPAPPRPSNLPRTRKKTVSTLYQWANGNRSCTPSRPRRFSNAGSLRQRCTHAWFTRKCR